MDPKDRSTQARGRRGSGKRAKDARTAPRSHFTKNVVIVVALLGAGFGAAWLRFRGQLGSEGAYSDGARVVDIGEEPVRYAVWRTPEMLAGEINTSSAENRPALSLDGRYLVFTVGERGANSELYVADMVDGQPVAPRPLTALNTPEDEEAPAFGANGLYFASDRPGGAGGFDLYCAPWEAGSPGPPEPLGGVLASPFDDTDPAPVPGRDALAFASNRGGRDFNLLYAQRSAPEEPYVASALTELCSPANEREPCFSSDGRAILFASDRAGGRGEFDLYRAFRLEEGWTPPRGLDGVNSPASERAPLASTDGFQLLFARTEPDGAPDLYRAQSLELFQLPGRPVGWLELIAIGSLLVLALLAYLAKHWSGIDTIYKCFLASVILHLLLLWWSQGVFIDVHGGNQPGDGGEGDGTISLRIRSHEDRPAAEWRVRAGGTDVAQANRAGGPARSELGLGGPERSMLFAADAGGTAAEPTIDARPSAPQARGDAAPGRTESVVGMPVGSSHESVEVAEGGEALERLAGGAPELALSAGTGGGGGGSVARVGGSSAAGPSGYSAGGGSDRVASPSAGAKLVAAAPEPAPVTAERGGLALGNVGPVGRSGAGGSEVALAQPASEPAGAPGSLGAPGGAGASAELSLAGLANAGGSARSGRGSALAQGPSRGAPADVRGGGSGEEYTATPGMGLTGLAPGPRAEPGAPRAGSAAESLGPAGRGSGTAVGSNEVAVRVDAPPGLPATGGGGNGGGDGAGSAEFDVGAASSFASAGRSGRTGGGGDGGVGSGPGRGTFGTGTGDDSPASPGNGRVAMAPARIEEPGPAAPQKWDHTPYQNRSGEGKARALELHGGSAETERAVALGLKYLAGIQRQEGHWGDLDAVDPKYGRVAVGKTGLCVLAFLGAGHTPASNTPYSRNVQRALSFLIQMQDAESGHFGDSSAYDHGIATYAIAECFALTHDASLRPPLERAVAHILAKQSRARDPRLFGGWGYYYADDREFDRWSRTSVTAWQVMALEAARLSGLEVPDAAFTDAATFLRRAEDQESGAYRYNHDPERLASGFPTLPASTPAALFALSLMGEDLASERHAAAREFILERAPDDYRYTSDDDFVHRAQGNLYFWYYATLALFRTGGAPWERWNAHLKDALLPAQSADGSWKPIDIYARYARDSREDKSYSTAMCVLSLEVYYRYYLPLLKVK